MARANVIDLVAYRQQRQPEEQLPDPEAFVTRAQLAAGINIAASSTLRAIWESGAIGLSSDQRESLKSELVHDLVPDLSAAVSDEINTSMRALKSEMKSELVEDFLPAVVKMVLRAIGAHESEFHSTLDELDREILTLTESPTAEVSA